VACESDHSRGVSTHVRLDLQKIVAIGGVARLECFVGNGSIL